MNKENMVTTLSILIMVLSTIWFISSMSGKWKFSTIEYEPIIAFIGASLALFGSGFFRKKDSDYSIFDKKIMKIKINSNKKYIESIMGPANISSKNKSVKFIEEYYINDFSIIQIIYNIDTMLIVSYSVLSLDDEFKPSIPFLSFKLGNFTFNDHIKSENPSREINVLYAFLSSKHYIYSESHRISMYKNLILGYGGRYSRSYDDKVESPNGFYQIYGNKNYDKIRDSNNKLIKFRNDGIPNSFTIESSDFRLCNIWECDAKKVNPFGIIYGEHFEILESYF